jgi:WD40 repeat protein
VRVWDPHSGQMITILVLRAGRVNVAAWSPDGTRLATGSNDGTVRVWDPHSGDPITTIIGHTQGVGAVAWSPDGTRLATIGYDRTLQVWDLTTGNTAILIRHTDVVRAVAWSPDGTSLATGGSDGIRVCHLVPAGRSTYLHLNPVECMDWSHAGIAIGGEWGVGMLDFAVS